MLLAAIEVSGNSAERDAMAGAMAGLLALWLVNLGLDLRGGAHLLAEVKVQDVYSARMKAFWPEVRDALRPERATIGTIRLQPSAGDQLKVRISKPEGTARALEVVRGLAQQVVSLSGVGASDIEVNSDDGVLTIHLSEAEKRATDERTMQQSLEIIRRRIDEVGTREPTIQRQGTDRILIQVPGIGSAAELKAIIGTTAQLTFQPVVGRGTDPDASAGLGNEIVPSLDEEGAFYTLESAPVVTGEELVDAQPAFDQNGRPAVNFRFNPTGARKFGDYTAENIGSPFAIVLDSEVISAPVIQSPHSRWIGHHHGQLYGRRINQPRGFAARGCLACGTGISLKNAPSDQSWARTVSRRASGLHRRLCGCADLYVPQLWHIRHFRQYRA